MNNRGIQTIIPELVKNQRKFFYSGKTRPLQFRLDSLKKLKAALKNNEALINKALKADLNKSEFETYMTETGMVLEEISFHLKHLRKWMKNRRVKTPIAQFHSVSFVSPEPHGVSLIMSPWNYPLQLCLAPVVGAISGGNCAVIKPSAYAPETSRAIAEIIGKTFPKDYLAVIEGGRDQNSALLEEKFDYIFFTGSVAVGKVVMEAASRNLTPVTLELGGKSPVIVDSTADIKIAAKRIAFGKVLNAGQTCVAPDYLMIHKSVKEEFISEYKRALESFFPGNAKENFPHIISEKHYKRVKSLFDGEELILGGTTDDQKRYIDPVLIDEPAPDSAVMQEEIFGPVLPLITFSEIEECIDYIRSNPKPLAFYLFTSSRANEQKLLDSCSFGGGCINDTIIHLANSRLGFGGVGESGMGNYHGKKSFDTFTHERSIVKKSTWIDLPMRYHPYNPTNLKFIRMFIH